MSSSRSRNDEVEARPFDEGPPLPEAPLSAGPPPLFDEESFSEWVTEVFTDEHEGAVRGKLAAVPADDDMSKMRLLLNEEAAIRRSRLVGDPIIKSYVPPEEGAGSNDTMIIAFAGENDRLGGLPKSGGIKPENFVKLCKKSGVRWALVVRDAARCWYQRGLQDGDTAGFNGVLSLLQAEIALVQPREVVMIGASMGGYAAIRAALALGARVVMAFSPQVLLSSEEREAVVAPTPWLTPYMLKLQLTAELESMKLPSLLQAVDTSPTSECLVQVHTGTLDGEADKELEMLRLYAARKLGPITSVSVKGCVGIKVSIRPHPTDDPLGAMKESGELQSLLKSYGAKKGSGTPKKKSRDRAALGRSMLWLSAAGREEAAAKAGMVDLSGPVVRPSDGRGFDPAQDARALPGEPTSQFKAMLNLWQRVKADDLPGFFFWHKPAFDLAHAHLLDIANIFFEYCKKGAAVGGAGKNAADGFSMSQREWVAMCKEAKVPVAIGDINEAHNRCDRPTEEAKKEAADKKKGTAAKSDKELQMPEFIEALLRLAVKLLATTSTGKKALKAGNGGEGFKRLMKKYILPLREKDSMAEMRGTMESAEVQGVLTAFREPLEKQFNAIAKRKSKILDPTKKPKEAAKIREDEPLLTIEEFCKDIDVQKMFVEIKEVVYDPIKGNPDINTYYELSRLDAERFFIEAQDRDEAILAMLTGDAQLMSQTSLLDFDEYQRLIALCGLNMFSTVERLPPGEKVEVFIRTMTAAVPELDYKDYVIRDRLNTAVKYAFSKGLVRFNLETDIATAEEKSVYDVPDWNVMWKKMDLSDCHGWPLWEKEVYLLLGAAFDELASIFSYYSKSGGVGSSAESAFVLQQAEVTNFAMDCGLAHKDFMMTRIHSLMEVSDQTDAKKVMHQRFEGDEAYDKRRKGGNNTLELFEFCELIVRVAFMRANPKYGNVGNREAKFPLPGILEKTLKEDILPKAKRDVLREILDKIKVDPEVQKHFKDYEWLPETRHKENGLKQMFKDKAYATRQGIQDLSLSTISFETLVIWLGPDFQGDGGRGCSRNILKDIMISPTPQVQGTVVEPRHSHLSNLDVKGCYSTAQKKGNDNKADGKDGAFLDYDEFLWTLGLCGHIKYEEITEMSLADRIEGIIRNFLQEEDEHKVISKYCYPPLPRYDASLAKPLDGESQADLDSFVMFWNQMDLSHMYGFPLFEEGVFNTLHQNFEALRSIFDYYAKSGTAGSNAAGALLTMQQTELQTLAIDTGLNSEKFSMTRVINIFKRADQVDDSIKETDADRRVTTGENADGGDRGLELHEFLECVVMLAFERTNPEYGEVGKNNKEFELRADGSVRKLAKAKEYIELPGCLEAFLKDVLLKKAKTDTLAKIKKVIQADQACQAVFKEHRAYFLEEFKERARDGNEAGKEVTWTLEIMMEDFLERKLLKDMIVQPVPAVSGTTPPKVHSNLAWLDAKGAFVTAQERSDAQSSKNPKAKKASEQDVNTTMTFDEFYMCVALCGHLKYEEVEQLTLAQRVEGIFYNYRHAQDGEKAAGKWSKGAEHKHGRKDETAWISECLYPPLPRYDYANSGADPEVIKTWAKMDLRHVLGFPVWEQGAFALFAKSYGELQSIFQQYAKSGAAGSGSAVSALTMQKTELTNLAMDCEICNAQFTDARLISIYERADQVDDTMYRDEATGTMKGESIKQGDRGLELHEFFEALSMIALGRYNPRYGTVGKFTTTDASSVVDVPMPDCLDKLLKVVLKKAKTDGLTKILKIVMKDPEIRAVFAAKEKNVNKLQEGVGGRIKGLSKTFDGLRKAFESHSNKKASATKEPTMTLEQFIEAMNKRSVAQDLIIDPDPAISGAYTPTVHSNLSQLDMRGAFVTAQGSGSGGGSNTMSAGVVIDYAEFCNLLGLCAYIKYEEIPEMSLAQKVEGIVDNFLMFKDEKAVVSECLYPPLPRFDYANSGADPEFLEEWAKMDLRHVFGFPTWEEAVFNLLSKHATELKAIFTHYCMSGTAGASSADMALTMQTTELSNLCLDIDILTVGTSKKDGFNMTRVINLFRRADQVDDTFQESKSDHRITLGETAKGGDRGLVLHEFYELLVMLGFYRFNPDYGEVGSNFQAEFPADQTLARLLDKHVLKNAKKGALAAVKAEILASKEIQELFNSYEKKLRKEWKGIANGSGPMKVEGKEVINMEMFCEDMGQQGGGKADSSKGSRRIVREINIVPTPAVKGMVMETYHSNLSQMDIKSAFLTAQNADTADDGVNSLLTVDFGEWVVTLALCGQIKYEEVEEMSLLQRIEGLFANYICGEAEDQWGSEHDVITKAVVEPIMRFDTSYSQPTGGQPRDEYEEALDVWNKMDLANVYGFPVWEPEVFELLKSNFGELKAIFASYALSGGTGSAKGAMTCRERASNPRPTMDQQELTQFSMDCSLETGEFPITRIITIFERADLVDENSKSRQKAGTGDGALELHEFFEALVMLAFHRAQPKYGEKEGEKVNEEVIEPLPGCLALLLENQILKNAKRDELSKTRGLIEKDRKILNKVRPRRDKMRSLFEAACKADKTIKKGPIPKMGIERFCDDLFEKKVIGEVKDAKSCFIAVQVGDADGETITFDEFMIAMVLCSGFKYGEVREGGLKGEGMDMAMRAEAICFNYTGEKDEAQAITDALFPPLVRYDPSTSGADSGFIGTWQLMSLDNLYGFPLWEEDVLEQHSNAVFFALYGAFNELQSIFKQYAKSNANAATSADLALTMQQTELTDLALDCSLATDKFPMERVVKVFESADAVKDEKALAKGAKADGALEMHEFLEAVVKIAFYRANPDFGEEGKKTKEFVQQQLPECLVSCLKDNLLLNAKRDALSEVKAKIAADTQCQTIIASNRQQLKSRLEKLAKFDAHKKGQGAQVSMERFTQELFELGLAKEVIVQPESAIKGKTVPAVRTNLTVIDAKGCFVTAQKVEAKNAGTTVNYDEFCVALALCGTIKYGEVEQMSLPQKVEAMFDNYQGVKDELGVLQPIVCPPPPRFNPVKFSVPGKPPPPATFMNAWEKMDLSHLWGFPEFEEDVFALLEDAYGELSSIFSQYAKSGTAGSATMSALLTMQQTEFTTFALDCGIMTDDFTTMRMNNIFIRADQVDDTLKATKVKTMGIKKDAKVGEQDVRALAEGQDQSLSLAADRIQEVETTVMKGDFAESGDKALTFPEFLEAIVACALFRANPDLGEHGHDECEFPLPDCLAQLLKNQVLANAKRDAIALVKSAFETDAEIQAMIPDQKKKMQDKRDADGNAYRIARAWDDVTAVGVRKVFGKQVMSYDMLQEELTKRNAGGKDITIKPAPKVKGDVFPERHMNLSWLDIKNAFTTCQNGFTGRDSAETVEGNETIDFDEFTTLLGLCGHIKYAEIDEMTLADKFLAMVDNWCMQRDEQAVIEDACVPMPPRFDFEKLAKPLKGQEQKEFDRLIATWKLMDLGHIYGFPVWEEAVFGIVQRSFSELTSIFAEYSKSGSAGSSSAKAAMMLQSSELTNIALDCELATDDFPMSRINMIFMRADQIDDTLVRDRSNKNNVQGKGAEAGDRGLELHEFLECLMLLAFSRQNPEFGNIGKQADPEEPMPGCFETVLDKNILKNARRDKLAKVRKMVDKDPEVAKVKRNRYDALRDQFELVCMKDATTMQGTKDAFGNEGDAEMKGVGATFGNEADESGAGSTLGMDKFCDELSDRIVSEDVKVTPTPNITGIFLPSTHCNLSWIECKGAFVTCQVGTALSDQTIDFEEFMTCLALCATIKYEKVKGLGNQGRPPNMKVGEQDDAGDPTPLDGAECPLAVMVDGIYANFLFEDDAHGVITKWQQPQLPRWDWLNSGADKKWISIYSKMDLSHVFGWPLWEKEVFELLCKTYGELKLIFQQYSKTGTAGSSTAEELFTMQKTELNNLSLDCGLATEDFPQARVIGVFQRANETDDEARKQHAAKKGKAKTSTVVLAQEQKMEKARSNDLGKNNAKAKVIEDKGLELHEFLECLVDMSFRRANPKYGQVGKTDASKGGIDMVLLPGCLETMLNSNLLARAKRDQVPGWLEEITNSTECQQAMLDRREAMRMRWRVDAGKGEQGSKMTNKNMTDGGLSMDMASFIRCLSIDEGRGLMRDITLPPRPPVVGMAVENVHLNLSALDIKAAFAGAQDQDNVQIGANQAFKQGGNLKGDKNKSWSGDALLMGNQNQKVNFEEWMTAIALCGHIKYVEVKGSKMADRVAGALDNYLGTRSEKQVISDILYPPPPRTKIADTAKPVASQPKEQHQLFIQTWKAAMTACLDIDVMGFPLWEEDVFKLLQPVFGELQAIFSNYAQSISGGSLQASTLQAVTMQDNELISFCRDSGLITEKLSNARVQSLLKDVANAFRETRSVGDRSGGKPGGGGTSGKVSTGAGQGGGTGVYSEGIHMPAFIVLLLLIALNRANPKLGQLGEAGQQAVDVPLPGCLESILQNQVLTKAKRSKMTKMKTEMQNADPAAIFSTYRGNLKKEFEAACKKREKMPAVSLFAKFMMSRKTMVADLKDRGLIVAKNVKGKPKVTGDAAAEMELTLSALDVESAFALCQAGKYAEAANDTIEFEEFLMALGMCGCAKYSAVDSMDVNGKCEAIIAEYLGKASIEDVVASAAPTIERYDPSASSAPPAFVECWKKMALESALGFPTWEEEVFNSLAEAFADLEPLFKYYAGDTPGMQQAELVDLALDNKMATKAYPITQVVALFEQLNKEAGGGDADFEMHEFLAFLVHLAFARDGPDPAALKGLLGGLRRSQRVEALKPVLAMVQGDETIAGAITAGEATLSAAFAKAGEGQTLIRERSLLQYLEGCKMIRAVIISLPGGAEGYADLTWQDASAAYQACNGGQPLSKEMFAQCLAVCAMVKYGEVGSLSAAQKVEGFLANLGGSKDEHAVVGA